jgi:broad specificity phosphatase PhoE
LEYEVIWYILRHAEKAQGDFYNPVLRHQDQPISAKGRADAEKLTSHFVEKSIASIYISEYLRTRQSIEAVAQYLKLSPIVDSRLNEIDNGAIEGMSATEIHQKFPAVWHAFKSRDRDFQFPQGESGAEAQQRIQSFFKEKLVDQDNIILVSHDGWMRLLVCSLLGLAVYRRWDFHVDTCGLMEIEYQPDFESWKLLRFNQSYK